eukprot:5269160-Karenia_brevis.AAC.1
MPKVASLRPTTADDRGFKFMMFDMREYCDDCVKLYTNLTGVTSFRPARTPFLSESSLPAANDEAKGELGAHASNVFMKGLWLA